MAYLKEIDLLKLSTNSVNEKKAEFTFEPLFPGYGHTLGNALRRVLLSSLKGSAITAIRINDITHEFTSIDGLKEDAIQIILNLKSVRIKYSGMDPALIKLSVKGPKEVKAGDFKLPAGVEIINQNEIIANIEKGSNLEIEAQVESGFGYVPTEKLNKESLPIGMIAIDAIFTPIKKINYQVTDTRVGQITNYDKLILEIETDGSISPTEALNNAILILSDHINIISLQLDNLVPKTTRIKSKTKKIKNNAK